MIVPDFELSSAAWLLFEDVRLDLAVCLVVGRYGRKGCSVVERKLLINADEMADKVGDFSHPWNQN